RRRPGLRADPHRRPARPPRPAALAHGSRRGDRRDHHRRCAARAARARARRARPGRGRRRPRRPRRRPQRRRTAPARGVARAHRRHVRGERAL
ncbi:MAG: hypothetical protein AVDCRST_MAG54-652, partial [uncultured Actinomycetospora sp.]